MNISWDPHPCNITGYVLLYNRTSTGEVNTIITNSVITHGVDCHQEAGGPYRCLLSTSSYILNIHQQYSYQVAAVNSYGVSLFSELVYAKGTEFINENHISLGRLNTKKAKNEL